MRLVTLGLCALLVSLAAGGTAGAASRQGLDMYTAKADAKSLAVIRSGGYDVAESHLGGGRQVDLVLTAREARRLRAEGVDVTLKRNARGQTVRQQADAMAAGGYNVYRSYDEAGGIRDELYALARRNPAIVEARGDRPHAPGAGDHRAQGHQERKPARGRRATGGALHGHDPRARVDLHRGQPPAAAPLRRQLRQERRGDEPRQHARALVRAAWRTRTATSTRSTPSGCGARTCATTTATARSRSATAST